MTKWTNHRPPDPDAPSDWPSGCPHRPRSGSSPYKGQLSPYQIIQLQISPSNKNSANTSSPEAPKPQKMQVDDKPSSPGLRLASVKGRRPGSQEAQADDMPLPPDLRLANAKGKRPGRQEKQLKKYYAKTQAWRHLT